MPARIPASARLAAALLAVALLAPSAPAGTPRARTKEERARVEAQLGRLAPLKRLQAEAMLAEPMREAKERAERTREWRELARKLRGKGPDAARKRADRAREAAPGGPPVPGTSWRNGTARAIEASALRGSAVATNVRVNDPAGDLANETQSETSIATYGRYMVAAWNDSRGVWDGSGQWQGWATSTDSGRTWVDRGTLPVPANPTGWRWASDPVVVVDPNTGAFYYAGLGDGNGNQSGIGVLKGRFSGTTFNWTTAVAARLESPSVLGLDKEWLDVDPESGRVYLSYTTFDAGLSRIEFQYADSSLATWSAPLRISPASEDGWVQGSRVAAAPGGAVYVAYHQIGAVDVDYLRVSRSTSRGASFATPVSAVGYYSNTYTGAPGFNRSDNNIPLFPGLAVDRSAGPYRGRLYLTWAESLNWYDDVGAVGSGGGVTEVEPDNDAAHATAFTPGDALRGALSSPTDLDYFAMTLTAGQHVLVAMDSLATGPKLWAYVVAADGATLLTRTEASTLNIAGGYGPTWEWTAPADGTYFLRIAARSGSGGYRLRTAYATHGSERGTDQRDVFVNHSDDGGATWSAPVRVDDSAPGYDGWLPEVAVSPGGTLFCAWYDWRDGPAPASGGLSSIHLARSADGGGTWTALGAVSDVLSDWTTCLSRLEPNQGDYMSLHASASTLAICWSDARGGNPDAYAAFVTLGAENTSVALVAANATPGRVDLEWVASPPENFRATLYRTIAGANAWSVLDTLVGDAQGHVSYADTAVALGTTYTWRLGVLEGGAEYLKGAVTVLVPSGLALALHGVYPNPTDGVSARIGFTLPYAEPVTVEVFDLSGRLLQTRRLDGLAAAAQSIPFELWPSARSGVYLVRITQRGRSLTSRVALVR